MGTEKKLIEWESLSKWEMGVMVIMLPIFAVVAGLEHVIAKLTGATYNEVNIIVADYISVNKKWKNIMLWLPCLKRHCFLKNSQCFLENSQCFLENSQCFLIWDERQCFSLQPRAMPVGWKNLNKFGFSLAYLYLCSRL